jgi:hypothetical protein
VGSYRQEVNGRHGLGWKQARRVFDLELIEGQADAESRRGDFIV